MKFSTQAVVPSPREVVFAAYRDRITRVLEFLPSVRAIDVTVRDEEGAALLRVSQWHGGGEVPAAVRGIVSQAMLGWTERAVWRADAFTCEWRVVPHTFGGAVRCGGRTSFVETDGGATRVEVEGVVEVDGRRMAGVPAYLGARVARSVEEFLVDRIRANLTESAKWFGAPRVAREAP
jgi:hypothetical protein